MFIKELVLKNYRNYDNIKINFNKKINIIYGENGQGKTNILESIYYLTFLKSHRINDETSLIRENCKKFKIQGKISKNNIIYCHEIELSTKKIVKIDKTIIKKNSDYITNINLVLFNPNDLDIIKGSPDIRRKTIDLSISQLNKNYFILINEYNKLLKMRNDYLKTIKNIDYNYFEILTTYLIEKAVNIYMARNKYIIKLNENINNIFIKLNNIKLNELVYYIKYVDSININKYNKIEIKKLLENEYNSVKKDEIKFKKTLFGPQKDDFKFILKDRDLKKYGSQGQQRIAIIAMKLAEAIIITNYTGENPILLLDDVLSELDNKKQNNLLKYISNFEQTIITTTDLNKIKNKILKEGLLLKINDGTIV